MLQIVVFKINVIVLEKYVGIFSFKIFLTLSVVKYASDMIVKWKKK